MQKNLYFRTVLRRRNILLEALLGLFMTIASYPRLLLEVFIRKNMGERYFSIASVVTIAAFFFVYPYVVVNWAGRGYIHVSMWELIKLQPSDYIFISVFVLVSIWQYFQILQGPSVFDFEKLSLSAGEINPLFYKIQLFGKPPSPRLVETVYEPLLFFVIGWVLIELDVNLGYTLVICAVIYSLSYVGAYKQGDDFIKDKIDEMIVNGQMENAFVGDEENNKKGVRFRMSKPPNRNMREDLVDKIVVEDDGSAEAF